MKRILLTLTALLVAFSTQAQNLEADFDNPPQDARIRVWWHWMDGNVSRDGIRKDIEWFSRAGIGGFHQFDAGGSLMGGASPIVRRLPYMSDEWKDALRYAIGLADSLGLEVAIASAPGWSSTGGPWVKPENAMKRLTWRTIEVAGTPKAKKPQSFALPEPYTTVGRFQNAGEGSGPSLSIPFTGVEPWYEDIAVLAVRINDADLSLSQLGASVSTSGGDFTLEQLTNGDLSDGALLRCNPSGSHAWIMYSFPEPWTIRAMSLVGGPVRSQWDASAPTYDNFLQASDDGILWHDVCRIPSGSVAQQTFDIPRTTARHFRLMVKNPVADNSYAAFGIVMPEPEGTIIHEFNLFTVTRINHAEEKAGFAAPHDLYLNPTPATAYPAGEAIDLTPLVKDGVLTWQVPEGRWRIYRFGQALTGKQNHPAPPEATGLEVDKLDADAWTGYFHGFLDMYRDASGGLLGQHGIQYLLTDSYEAEEMTWTAKMREQFLSRRGYDLLPWMPVLAGEIIGSSEASEQFLFDWRETIGELFAENYDRINSIIASYGMKGRYTESHENGRVFVGDGMDLKMTATVPMSAIWMPGTGGGSTIEMARADIKESSSTAHVFGQNIAAAESFTAAGLIGNAWSYHPGNIKPVADLAMSEGLNRFVIHESAHQPSDDHRPGLGLMIFGQWFNRHDTWAEYARYWSDYLARSCYMLQQGRYVADILWYYGEDTNITGIYGHELPGIPEGYAYDFINPRGVLDVLGVKDGKLVTVSGMQYRVLVLGGHCKVMSLDVLRKLHELVEAGAVICGQVPESPAGLCDDKAEFDRLVADIWRSGRPNVHEGQLANVLKAAAVEPDFRYVAPAELKYVHRTSSENEIYWVCNFSDHATDALLCMRDADGPLKVLNPETGKELPGALNGSTLHLESGQALFIVSDKTGKNAALSQYKAPVYGETISTDVSWKVSFEGIMAPEGELAFETLKSYTESEDPAIKYFSGTATYLNTFTIGKKELPSLEGVSLDLGEVGVMADVYVNGEHAGFLWRAPFRLDFNGTLKAGVNALEIKVVNLWPNRLIGDAQPGASPQTYTTMPFYRADSPLLPSGLMSPVTITKLLK